jgi:thiazolinyl imide reductase
VVVCGTRFGRIYLAALGAPECPFELAGILARGSARSRACAEHYGVPLFTTVDDVPDGVDIACVVVSAAINGGPGAELAQQLMRRGIHVLQEHQLDEDELAACLRTARRNGVVYRLNTLYRHIEPVRRFIAAARELLARRELLYVEAATAFPVSYSLLDVLGQALGKVRPWGFADAASLPAHLRSRTQLDPPFRTIDGVLAGVPFTLRMQYQMDASDPENHAHLFHRITVGTDGGTLMLVNTHGPVLWSPRPRLPEDLDDTVQPDEAGAEYLQFLSTAPIGPVQAPSYLQIMSSMWPAGVRRALAEVHAAVQSGQPAAQDGQYHLTLCRLFAELVTALGPLDLQRRSLYQPLDATPLTEAAAAAVPAPS